MGATEELRTDHRAIERMLAVLEAAAGRLEAGQQVRPGLFREAVDFVRNFADRCHHGKEEGDLFARLEKRGVPRQDGPIGMMLFEHEAGRRYIGAIAEAIDAYEGENEAAAQTIAENARGYVGLLRGHIRKEEDILFPAAEQITVDIQVDPAAELAAKEFERAGGDISA